MRLFLVHCQIVYNGTKHIDPHSPSNPGEAGVEGGPEVNEVKAVSAAVRPPFTYE